MCDIRTDDGPGPRRITETTAKLTGLMAFVDGEYHTEWEIVASVLDDDKNELWYTLKSQFKQNRHEDLQMVGPMATIFESLETPSIEVIMEGLPLVLAWGKKCRPGGVYQQKKRYGPLSRRCQSRAWKTPTELQSCPSVSHSFKR